MTTAPDKLLAMRIGQSTVGDNIARAIKAGEVVEDADGTLRMASERPPNQTWAYVDNGPPLGCGFLMDFMYRHAYALAAVPHGCHACYKVKVVLKTLRQLVAAWQLAERIQCRSKWGLDFNNPYSPNVYAGYFYTSGLEGARATYKVVRESFSADPTLGADLAITIKRGCSEYEARLGPSDRYEFTPEMAELETTLKARFKQGKRTTQSYLVLANWIDTAFRMGDETYLEFTGGRRRRVGTVTYAP